MIMERSKWPNHEATKLITDALNHLTDTKSETELVEDIVWTLVTVWLLVAAARSLGMPFTH